MSAIAFTIGQRAIFSGYAQPLPAGQPAILQPGQEVEIYDYGKDQGNIVPNSFQVKLVGNDQVVDMVFTNEIQPLPSAAAVVEAGAAPAPAPAPAPVATPAPAPAAPAPAVSAAPAEAPAPATSEAAPAKPAKKRGPKPKSAPAEAPAAAPASTEAVVATPAEAAPVAETFVDTEFAKQVVGDDAIAAAKRLVLAEGQNDYALGATLSNIYRNKTYLNITHNERTDAGDEKAVQTYAGEKGFERFIEEYLGTGYRTAKYKIEVYEGVAKLGLDPVAEQRIIALGYTKMKDLVKVMTKENALEMVAFGETKNSVEVQKHVQTVRVAAGDEGVRQHAQLTKFRFGVHNDIGVNIQAALDHALRQAGEGATLNDAFALMAQKYMENEAGAPVSLEAEIERLENTYGIKVAVTPVEASAAAPVAQV